MAEGAEGAARPEEDHQRGAVAIAYHQKTGAEEACLLQTAAVLQAVAAAADPGAVVRHRQAAAFQAAVQTGVAVVQREGAHLALTTVVVRQGAGALQAVQRVVVAGPWGPFPLEILLCLLLSPVGEEGWKVVGAKNLGVQEQIRGDWRRPERFQVVVAVADLVVAVPAGAAAPAAAANSKRVAYLVLV